MECHDFYFCSSESLFARKQPHKKKSIKVKAHVVYERQFLPSEDLLLFLEMYFHLDVQ